VTTSANNENISLDEAVFFVNANGLECTPNDFAWGLPTRTLRKSSQTGIALDVSAAENWAAREWVKIDRAVELVMLEGTLNIDEISLQAGDFLRISPHCAIAPPCSPSGARFLMFADNGIPIVFPAEPSGKTPNDWLLVHDADSKWVSGTAMAEAGRHDVPLKIKHFKQDPDTGARTYLVAVKPGVSIPWEMHDVSEESYIIDGDFTLPECLPGGIQIGHYTKGGYFYRPPGISHSGPDSGTQTGTVMLIRTPGPLTVILVEGC
jgi:quercetin dioxygenase-like cupin family protein